MIQHESKKMTHLKAILLRSLLFLLDMGIMTLVKTEKAPARGKFYTPTANRWVKSQILTFCTMSFVDMFIIFTLTNLSSLSTHHKI